MCTVMAGLGAAMSVGSSLVKFMGEQQATDAYNAQAAAAHRDASLAATYKYQQEADRYRYDARAAGREGYKTEMQARQAQGIAAASAGSSGIDASSLTFQDIIAKQKQDAAATDADVQAKKSDLRQAYSNDVLGYQAEAQGRINATPFKSGPSALGLAIDLGDAAIGAWRQTH